MQLKIRYVDRPRESRCLLTSPLPYGAGELVTA